MQDGEPDFSRYTAEQITRSLASIDREKYPLNYANLLAAQRALPPRLDPAELEASRIVALRQEMASGEVWLSSPATVLVNTLLAGAVAAWGAWLAWRFVADPANVWNVGRMMDWPEVGRQAFGLLIIASCAILAWTLPGLRRVVMREGRLEVRSLFARMSVDVQDIERIRWRDRSRDYENTAAIIELRADSGLGRRVRFMPRSAEIMRAFLAHVATISGRAEVVDPTNTSNFYVGAADP